MSNRKEILKLIIEDNPKDPLQYAKNIVKSYCIKELNNKIKQCKDCSFYSENKTIALGNPKASIMFIGDGMVKEQLDDNFDSCFNQVSIEILEYIYDEFNINSKDIFYMNLINCYTNKLKKSEKRNCGIFLDYAIKVVEPKCIILLGNIAFNYFQKGSIKNNRGNWIDIKGIPAMPTYNPNFLFEYKNSGNDIELYDFMKKDFYDDITEAFNFIKNNYPETNLFL